MRSLRVWVGGVVLGILGFIAFRLLFVPVPRPPHYHANFAIVLEGRRVDLTGRHYMEEVGACRLPGGPVAPSERVHLHNQNADVVHVHQPGATWGHLLANINFGLGSSYLVTDEGRFYVDGGGKTLKFILHGNPQSSVHNQLINSGDRLLISYGSEKSEDLVRTQFPMVASDAEEYNRKRDPAGCSGATDPTFWERVQHAVAG